MRENIMTHRENHYISLCYNDSHMLTSIRNRHCRIGMENTDLSTYFKKEIHILKSL